MSDAWDNLFAWGDEMRAKYGITREDVAKAVDAVRQDLAEKRKVKTDYPASTIQTPPPQESWPAEVTVTDWDTLRELAAKSGVTVEEMEEKLREYRRREQL